jgi:general secretion pathway protein G
VNARHDRHGADRPAHVREGGFTLIEVLIVMVIITILAGISLGIYNNSIVKAREAVLLQQLSELREAMDRYYADKNKWPSRLETLVDEKYIRAVPVDPLTNSATTWQTTYGEPDPSNPSAEPGISDVHSGAEQVSPLTGTPYSEW